MNTVEIWTMTVVLFAQGVSTVQDTKEFANLETCIAASQQIISDQEAKLAAKNEHVTASCTPKSTILPK